MITHRVQRCMVRTAAVAVGTLTVAAVGVLPAFGATTTLYVGTTSCSDGGAGTADQPYCTLAKAASVVTAGQTVAVSPGDYVGNATVGHSGTAGNPITFSAPNGGVNVVGGTHAFTVSAKQYVTIDGFDISDTTSYGVYLVNASNLVVSGNTVTGSGHPAKGEIAAGIFLSGVSDSVVTRNVTEGNSDSGIYLKAGTTNTVVSYNESSRNANGYQRNANGINVVSPRNTILGNILHDNEDSGLQFYTGGDNNLATLNVTYNNGDHGIDDLNVTGGRLIGNTVYHNCTSGINVEGTSGNYVVKNNIAVDNAVYAAYNGIACSRRAGNIGIWDSAPPTTTVDHNLVWLTKPGTMYTFGRQYSSLAAMQQDTGQERHGVEADPQFASTSGSRPLQLRDGSPAIDAADSGVSGEQDADVLGKSRVDDPNVANTNAEGPRAYDDMGAYELTQWGPPPPPAQQPTARLALSPTSGEAPLDVTADASGSTDPQGQTLSYRFDFGDGTSTGTQAQATATHTYSAAGSYTVTVTVTNTSDLSSTATQTLTVTAGTPKPQPPSASLTVSPASGTAPLAVSADASASTDPQGQTLSYRFDFGDGTVVGPQPGSSADHTYSSTGTFPVTVTVTNTAGLSSTASQSVTVGSASSAPADYVSQIATNYSASSTLKTSGNVAVWRASGVQAGDLVIVTLQLTGTSSTGAVTGTDSAGNTYGVASDVSDGAGNRLVVLYGVAQHALASGDRITATFPGAATYRMTGDEASGVSTPDRTSSAAGTGATFDSGVTAATGSPNELVFGAVAVSSTSAPGWAAGWRGLSSYATGSASLGRAYQLPSSTGTFDATGTATGNWLASVVTFRS